MSTSMHGTASRGRTGSGSNGMAFPDVSARFDPPGSLIVDECPFCKRTHFHGCGIVPAGEQPDRSWYGIRTTDCREGDSYVLVPVDREASR
jgi:hypothetical protein